MTIAHVISWTGAQGNGVSTINLSAIDTTGANFIAVALAANGTLTSVTDSKGNTYQTAIGPIAGSTDNVYIAYAENPTVGSGHTITVTHNGNFGAAGAAAYSGMLTSATLDKTASGTGTGTALNSGNTATIAQADELLIGAGTQSVGSDITWTAGANYTVRSQHGGASSGAVIYMEDRIVSATGAYNAPITSDQSGAWAAVIATFKGTSGGGGGTVNTQTLTDTISVSDLGIPSQVRGRLSEDTFAVSDASIQSIVRGRLNSDTLTIADSFDGIVVRGRLGSDNVVLTDEGVLFYRRNRLLESAVTITDEALASIVGNNILTKILSSTIDVTDGSVFSIIRARLLQDTIIVSEGSTDQFINTNIVADDTIEVTDEYLAKLIWRRVLGDTLTITDEALAALIGQNVITKVLTSAITTADDALLWLNRFRTAESFVLTSDETIKVLRFTRELTDAIDIIDSAQAAMQRFVMLTDLLSVDDNFVSLFITPTTVAPVIVIGFDQPDIRVGGYGLA